MNKILCIGEALIDMICTDKGNALSNGNNFLKKAGGAPTNVAVAIKAFGGNIDIAAKVGNDPFGTHIIDLLKSYGLNTKFIFKDNNYFTTLAFVSLLDNGERDFFFNRGADGNLNKEDMTNIQIPDYSIVHLGSATAFLPGELQKVYLQVLEEAIKQNCFISFDPNYRHLLYKDCQESFINQSEYFIEKAHFIKLSDEEALLITKQQNVEDAIVALRKKTNAIITITLGKTGTLLCFKQHQKIIPSIEVNPIDTTGAGDAFVGATLFQLNHLSFEEINNLNFNDWENIVFNANKAGAKTCTYYGAMEALQHLSTQIFTI
ncbi:MAG: carbohydrate kinase [Sediminibacterium sp.]|nr:carbohydrate kinase [Sediminibacterium sp.]